MDAVNDRTIQYGGTPEHVWLPWLAAQNFRQASLSALCPPGSRLVVVAPHPDDEILACGGLLATAIQQRVEVRVIAVTDGEASHGGGLAKLGARRVQESAAGLRVLGADPDCVSRLALPDGTVVQHRDTLAHTLQSLLTASDVVVSTWALDGHPDHEATGEVVFATCAVVGCRLLQAPVWMWHWSTPDDSNVPWGEMVAFDVPARSQRLKRAALTQHQSQLEDRDSDLGPVLVPTIVQRAGRSREYFFTKAVSHA